MRYVAGIDLGTSSVKTMIMDMDGTALGIGRGGYDVQFPMPAYAEQDPEKWWEAVKKTLWEACRNASISPFAIGGIGFSGQMHGMVALDRDKELVCPAVIHLDQRSGELLPDIQSLAGNLMAEELRNMPSAGMLVSTLYWLKEKNPEAYGRIRYVMSPKDYIRFRFCGEIGTDASDASATLAFSIREHKWCAPLLERLGIRKDIWPKVHESCEIAGRITAGASLETGLSQDTLLVYGAGDSMAAMTGNGVVEQGTMACNIGTSSQLAAVIEKPLFDPKLRLQTWCHAVPGRWVVQSGALNGGSVLQWFRDKILKSAVPFAELDKAAAKIPAGSEGLYFLPYLAGERTPYNDPYAKGIYFGLGLNHGQAHMVRATMEGVLFNLKECLGILDGMGVRRDVLIASGGAAKGTVWKQIQADMLEMPVCTTQVEEEACHGAAVMAAVGTGNFKTIQEACEATIVMDGEMAEPVSENVRIYREKQAIFREIYLRARDIYPRIQ